MTSQPLTFPELPRATRRRIVKKHVKQWQYAGSGFYAPGGYVEPEVRGKRYPYAGAKRSGN
jgi:hypothetical protein